LAAIKAARENPDPPEKAEPANGPPPAVRWARRRPEAAARLDAVRAGLTDLSQQLWVPTENLISPELVRRLCWDWEDGHSSDPESLIDEFLRAGQAREWQRTLVVPVLAAALQPPAA
jgi:ribonuclease D